MASISNDAQKVLQGASPEAIQYVTSNATGGKLTSGEAQALLSKFKADPSRVLSSQNITQANTTPTPRPDDLLGIRSQIMNEVGVGTRQSELDAAQAEYQKIYDQLSQFDTATDEQNRKIGEQALSTNVLRGEQATASNLRSTERSSIARAADVAAQAVESKRASVQAARAEAESQFNIRQQEVNDKRQLILQYPGAGITFGDSFETISSKLGKYQEQQKKDAYKETIKSKLMDLGLETSGNTKKLESRLKKANKKAYDQTLKEIDQKNQMFDLQIQDTKSQIAKRNSGGDGLTPYQQYQIQKYEEEKQAKEQSDAASYMNELASKVLDPKSPLDKESAKQMFSTRFPDYNPDDLDRIIPEQPQEQTHVLRNIGSGISNWWNSWSLF